MLTRAWPRYCRVARPLKERPDTRRGEKTRGTGERNEKEEEVKGASERMREKKRRREEGEKRISRHLPRMGRCAGSGATDVLELPPGPRLDPTLPYTEEKHQLNDNAAESEPLRNCLSTCLVSSNGATRLWCCYNSCEWMFCNGFGGYSYFLAKVRKVYSDEFIRLFFLLIF